MSTRQVCPAGKVRNRRANGRRGGMVMVSRELRVTKRARTEAIGRVDLGLEDVHHEVEEFGVATGILGGRRRASRRTWLTAQARQWE